jgi:hypothetical protein
MANFLISSVVDESQKNVDIRGARVQAADRP